MKRTFNDCFYNSENHKGFIEILASVDSEKLSTLIGNVTNDDINRFDIYLKCKIGFLPMSPLLVDIFKFSFSDFSSLNERQAETAKLFFMLRYEQLVKIKNILVADISVNNGYIKSEDVSISRNDVESVSSFNSDSLEDNEKNDFQSDTDRDIVRKDTNTKTTIENIVMLSDFYKKSIFDYIIDYVKDLFTLQVVE